MVVFVDQMSELLDLALEKYHSLTEAQREELATYIIPEVSEGYLAHGRFEDDTILVCRKSYVSKGRVHIVTTLH